MGLGQTGNDKPHCTGLEKHCCLTRYLSPSPTISRTLTPHAEWHSTSLPVFNRGKEVTCWRVEKFSPLTRYLEPQQRVGWLRWHTWSPLQGTYQILLTMVGKGLLPFWIQKSLEDVGTTLDQLLTYVPDNYCHFLLHTHSWSSDKTYGSAGLVWRCLSHLNLQLLMISPFYQNFYSILMYFHSRHLLKLMRWR